jgi:hypothetical protein
MPRDKVPPFFAEVTGKAPELHIGGLEQGIFGAHCTASDIGGTVSPRTLPFAGEYLRHRGVRTIGVAKPGVSKRKLS